MQLKNLILFSLIFFLVSCATTPTISNTLSTNELRTLANELSASVDINISEFDPGINGDPDTYAQRGIWPEIRRVESRKFASDLQKTLKEIGRFENVYITPSSKYLSDISISGAIKQSSGEDLHLKVTARDSSNKVILDKVYKHRVKQYFFTNLRNKGKDPYDPIMKSIAADLIKKLSNSDLAKVKQMTEIRYAHKLNEAKFDESLIIRKNKRKGDSYSLGLIPAENDPLFIASKNTRTKDLSFRQDIQTHYEAFNAEVSDDYKVYQEAAFTYAKKKREAEERAAGQALAGILLAAAAVYAASEADPYTYGSADTTAILAGLGSVALFSEYAKSSSEGEAALASLSQNAQSLESQVAPTVIEFEGETLKFEGSISQQFAQWQDYLNDYYVSQSKLKKEIELL
tara:strand:- start:6 stop:1211 length:1206 start_codon:yes stop_codon:yes gene_type:complete